MGCIHFACIMCHSLAHKRLLLAVALTGLCINIDGPISIAIFNKNEQCLDTHLVRCDNTLISLCIHIDDPFVKKFIENKKVKSTTTVIEVHL